MSGRLPRGPYVLLGLMTLATFGGPVAIVASLRGGASREWPPDRPVEWWIFGLTTGLVVGPDGRLPRPRPGPPASGDAPQAARDVRVARVRSPCSADDGRRGR